MLSKLCVLVVDDEPSAVQLTGQLVEMLGHEAHAFNSPVAVLKAVGEVRPHVVLSDIGMPQMNGYQLARCLRKNPVTKDTILVAVTAFSEEEHRRRAVEAGFDYRLVKPLSADELQSLLEDVVSALNKK